MLSRLQTTAAVAWTKKFQLFNNYYFSFSFRGDRLLLSVISLITKNETNAEAIGTRPTERQT
jgi:hypothetical protein